MAEKRSSDRRNFLDVTKFIPNQARIAEIDERVRRLLPHWHNIETLTLLKGQSIEPIECRFATIHGKEVCMLRFLDKFTRLSGTTTDTESPRTLFLFQCSREWFPFVVLFKVDFKLPRLLRAVAGIAHSASNLINKGQVTLGIQDPILLKKTLVHGAPEALHDLYTKDAGPIENASHIIFSHLKSFQDCGTLGIYCRDGYVAIESIYWTPSNQQGSKYVVTGGAAWGGLQEIVRDMGLVSQRQT